MSDLYKLTIVQLSDGIASRDFSPREVVEACLVRIKEKNEAVNAFVSIAADQAVESALAAEMEIGSGNLRGPLHGVPIGHKDIYCTKGLRTTAGSAVCADFVPDIDATVVAKFRDVGMVTLGKLNTHEFAYGPTNENSLIGPCRNPWDVSRISGGSSGGSGAALALRLIPAATGSDTGGSVRIPAACCGVTGLKPTYGRVSRQGIVPLCWTMDHPGPLARNVEDVALLLAAMAGPDPNDAASAKRAVSDYRAALSEDVSDLRIGVPNKFFFDRCEADVEATVRKALADYEAMGATLIEVDIPHIEHAPAAALAIYLAEAVAYHDDQVDQDPTLYSEQVRTFIELGNQVLAKDYLHAQRYRTMLGRTIVDLFDEVDLLATPTVPIAAPPLGVSHVDIEGKEEAVFGLLLRNTEPFNLTGLPALAIPCGFSDGGLPISLQLAGPAFSEARVLSAGHAYQQATDWHLRSPPN